jgi:hypothetical protein
MQRKGVLIRVAATQKPAHIKVGQVKKKPYPPHLSEECREMPGRSFL